MISGKPNICPLYNDIEHISEILATPWDILAYMVNEFLIKLLPFLFSNKEITLFLAQRKYQVTVHKARLAVLAIYVGAKTDAVFVQKEMGKMTAIV